MRLTSYADYGLRVLMVLASRADDRLITTEIAEALGVSRNHLLKVVNRLCDLGWVEAKPGPSGGVRFAPEARDVTVGEVVRRLEARLEIVECFAPETNACPIAPVCRLAPLLRRASEAFLAELDAVRLGELVPRPRELRRAVRTTSAQDRAACSRRGRTRRRG